MKLLAFAYPEETAVFHIMDQYLFGEELMVCPVTEPMYYGENSTELTDTVKTRRVYLPEAHGWYDYWTNTYYEGGQWIEVCASIDRIPLFVKEGGILLKTDFAGSTKELDGNCSVTVYTGRDGCFDFYEDEGEGYDYEEGKYRLTRLTWKEADQDSQHRGDDTGIPVEQYRQALSDPEGIYGRERVTILYKRKLLLLKR